MRALTRIDAYILKSRSGTDLDRAIVARNFSNVEENYCTGKT
jgi:hypothetical protein